MKDTVSGRQTTPAFARRIGIVAAACLLLVFVLAGLGCSSPAAPSSTSASITTTTTAPETTTSVALNPTQLGQAIAETWAEAAQALNGLLDDQPDVVDAAGELAAIKEGYVQKLVALGKRKTEFDAAARAQVDATITAAIRAAEDEEWHLNYLDIREAYVNMSADPGFVNLISSFNTLTQYADFELLKKQAPEEAARLGIE